MCWRPRESSCEDSVAHLVRSFGLAPEFFSHDWHVQPDCQRPNRTPPERRVFGKAEILRVPHPSRFSKGGSRSLSGQDTPIRSRLSSKPYKHTVRRKILSTLSSHRFPDDFHNGKTLGRRAAHRKQVPRRPFGPVRNDKFLELASFPALNCFIAARLGMVFRFGASFCARAGGRLRN
jgi:hypothetical protein